MRQKDVTPLVLVALALVLASVAHAQPPRAPSGPAPTHADIAYAPAEPADSKGHLLDLYLPARAAAPTPVVIWTSGSAWMADNGKSRAEVFAAELNEHGFAVAGVSIRSS